MGGGRFAKEQAGVQGRALAEVSAALAGAREEHLQLHKELLRLKTQVRDEPWLRSASACLVDLMSLAGRSKRVCGGRGLWVTGATARWA